MLVNQLNLIPSTNTNFIKKYSTYSHIYKTYYFPINYNSKKHLKKYSTKVAHFKLLWVKGN